MRVAVNVLTPTSCYNLHPVTQGLLRNVYASNACIVCRCPGDKGCQDKMAFTGETAQNCARTLICGLGSRSSCSACGG
jgi:hypothetical protein